VAPGVGEGVFSLPEVTVVVFRNGDSRASGPILRCFEGLERGDLFRLADRAFKKLELAALRKDAGRMRKSFWEYGTFAAGTNSFCDLPMLVIWNPRSHKMEPASDLLR
jgi:hypothetical protein